MSTHSIDIAHNNDPKDGDTVAKDECENCEYVTELMYYESRMIGKRNVWLCEICASTQLARGIWYPNRVDDIHLYQSIAWVANRILDEMRKK